MSEAEVLGTVRRYLHEHAVNGIQVAVAGERVQRDGDWWFVPVRPENYEPKTYEYYVWPADVEIDLEEKEGLNVLLVPSD